MMTTHDRITKLLMNRTPSMEDTGSAIWRALSKKSTFGEELNAIRAGRIQDEATLYDIFAKERGAKLAERKQGFAEEKLVWDQIKELRNMGAEDSTAFANALELLVKGEDNRAKVAAYMAENKIDADVLSANRVVGRVVSQMKASGQLKGAAVEAQDAIRRAREIAEARREPIAQAAERARAIAEAKREEIGDAAARAEAIAGAQERATITPRTDLGDIEADLQAGLITEDEASEQERIVKLTAAAGLEESPAKDEFNRNLQRVLQLERTGQTNSREYEFLAKRLQKQTEDAPGLSIDIDEQGNMSIRFGADPESQALAAGLTARQALQQQAQLDVMDTTIERLNTIIAQIEERPTRAGIIGVLKSFAQNIVGVVEDIAPADLANRVKETIALIPGLSDEDTDEFGPFFDPKLPESEIYQNTIALELAKLRIQSGDKNIRALKVTFDIALKDVKLRGGFASKTALVRLRTVLDEFQTERAKLSARLRSRRETGEVPVGVTSEEWRFMTSEERELFR